MQLTLFEEFEPVEQAAVLPTVTKDSDAYFIEYYDQDERTRLTWVRATNEVDARIKFDRDAQYRKCRINKVYESERTFDELESIEA